MRLGAVRLRMHVAESHKRAARLPNALRPLRSAVLYRLRPTSATMCLKTQSSCRSSCTGKCVAGYRKLTSLLPSGKKSNDLLSVLSQPWNP